MYKLIILATLLTASAAAKLPSYFTKCKQGSDEFAKCLLDNARDGIKKLSNEGDEALKINSLKPIKVTQIKLQASPSLKVTLNDVNFFGFDTLNFTDIELSKNNLTIKSCMDYLELISKYDVQGKILVLPIQGNGNMNLSLSNLDIVYTAKLIETDNNGKLYYKIDKDKITLEIRFIYYHLDNLFNGNKQLGDEMNRFLNESWRAVFEEMKDAVSRTIASVYNIYIAAYFNKIPINDLIE